jgi:hypothetical protein
LCFFVKWKNISNPDWRNFWFLNWRNITVQNAGWVWSRSCCDCEWITNRRSSKTFITIAVIRSLWSKFQSILIARNVEILDSKCLHNVNHFHQFHSNFIQISFKCLSQLKWIKVQVFSMLSSLIVIPSMIFYGASDGVYIPCHHNAGHWCLWNCFPKLIMNSKTMISFVSWKYWHQFGVIS